MPYKTCLKDSPNPGKKAKAGKNGATSSSSKSIGIDFSLLRRARVLLLKVLHQTKHYRNTFWTPNFLTLSQHCFLTGENSLHSVRFFVLVFTTETVERVDNVTVENVQGGQNGVQKSQGQTDITFETSADNKFFKALPHS